MNTIRLSCLDRPKNSFSTVRKHVDSINALQWFFLLLFSSSIQYFTIKLETFVRFLFSFLDLTQQHVKYFISYSKNCVKNKQSKIDSNSYFVNFQLLSTIIESYFFLAKIYLIFIYLIWFKFEFISVWQTLRVLPISICILFYLANTYTSLLFFDKIADVISTTHVPIYLFNQTIIVIYIWFMILSKYFS